MKDSQSPFARLLLPGLAFKAAVIGGGYATGRELATFFLPSGVRGGLYGMLLVIPVWSIICALTFLVAYQTRSYDYRSFFQKLLGPLWWLFEAGWVLALLVILAVFSAAAGEIGFSLLHWPRIVGELLLVGMMAAAAGGGGRAVEWLFKWVSFILYGIFIALFVLIFSQYGNQVLAAFSAPLASGNWAVGGLTYSGYNIIGAVVVLPVARHFTSRRDAVTAGLLAGPLAMFPAFLFFAAMAAFYPEIQTASLPSDYLLQHLNMPWFRIAFQVMIFCALLESGTSGLHAINERIAAAYERGGRSTLSFKSRAMVSAGVLVGAVFVATAVGLVGLVASGYLWLGYFFLTIYAAPLLIYGPFLIRRSRMTLAENEAPNVVLAP